MQPDLPYAIHRTVALPFDQADQRIREALGGEGFGVLAEIDVRATLRKLIEVDIPRYSILGAFIPRLAHQAILCEADVGLLLTCTVVLRELDAGHTVVAALDPVQQLQLSRNAALDPIAAEVRERLARAVARVSED
jgi:uncharacterized protein (DUF302 family)